MVQLSPSARRELRARAHALHPVVAIAENGLTEAVLKEIDSSLTAHELIKIRVYGDSRDDREAYLAQICAALGAAAVQQIGKLLIVYRPRPATATAPVPPRTGRSRSPVPPPRRTKRSFQG